MRRRALLAGLSAGVAGLAGCSFGDDDRRSTPVDVPRTDSPGGTDTPTPTDEPSRPDDPPHVVDLATGPRTYALPSHVPTEDGARVALWFARTATDDGPALVRGWLRNGNDFANTFRLDRLPMVGDVYARQPDGHDHEAALHLAPTEHNELATTVPSVVRDETGYWRVESVGPWVAERRRLAPGEWVRLEYHVVGSPGMSGRPVGSYRFGGGDDAPTIAVWNTERPGPTAQSRFADRSVSALGETAIQWFHEADPETTVFVRPAAERVELDGVVTFEAVNHSQQRVQCGHWQLYKLVDGEWFSLGPRMHTSDCRLLPPGGTKRWTLRAFHGEAVGCGPDCYCEGHTRPFLGGGLYAAVAGYGHPEPESGALVELVGDPVRVRPTEGATASRDGATVTVTSGQYGDGAEPPDATLTVQRTDDADERLLPEQVMHPGSFPSGRGGLRNALPFFEAGVERVVLRTDADTVDRVLGYDEPSRRFAFEGQAYRATRGPPE